VLDTLAVERERGITVKAQSASMVWRHPETMEDYLLNLVDTPGHVDFSYEVSRALASCQGALLLVDCAQGVQAQTVANHQKARDAQLSLIPVLTKIDLPSADPEPVLNAMQVAFGFLPDSVLWTSAKTGAGIEDIFKAIVDRIPPPRGGEGVRSLPLRALLVDAWHDTHRGVACLVAVIEGGLQQGDTLLSAHSGEKFTVQEVGLLAPSKCPVPGLRAGNVGYLYTNMKSMRTARVGDTFFLLSSPSIPSTLGSASSSSSSLQRPPPLPGFLPAKPMVFASLYPVDASDFATLATAVSRLTLNDASVTTERESSEALGFGLRCGFLGLLHMDVFVQRLRQEFDAECIVTAPCVPYRVEVERNSRAAKEWLAREGRQVAGALGGAVPLESTRVNVEGGGEAIERGLVGENKGGTEAAIGVIIPVERPGDFPPSHDILTIWEPTAHVTILAPSSFLSPLLKIFQGRRGDQEDVIFMNGGVGGLGEEANNPPFGNEGVDAADDASNDNQESLEEEEEEEEEGKEEEEVNANDKEAHDDVESFKEGGGTQGESPPSAAQTNKPSHAPLTGDRVVLKYRVPWAELVAGFYDDVKSVTAGYASVDWTHGDYAPVEAVKVDILLNGKPVDALSFVAHKGNAVAEGRRVCKKLVSVIPRQQFEVVVQATLGSKVCARERIAPYRKDVLIKSGKTVGGGDVSRKQKLLAKQREGKKRMKTVGSIELSQEAFLSVITKK